MIVVNLMGGLGNQMFQYAMGRRLALHHHTELFLDFRFLNSENPGHIKREYELGVFKIQARGATEKELKKFSSSNAIVNRIKRHFPGLFPYKLISEESHAFNANILTAPDNAWLNGFWQTEKYFTDIEKQIRSDFDFKSPLHGLNRTLAEKIIQNGSVSIHVRRGDYTSPDALAFHGICSPDYYYQAIETLSKKAAINELFLFSDDTEWVKQNMQFSLPVTYIDHNTGKKSFEDMRLMSLCNHNIIANSSFSWWGAWLNTHENKIVIAPKNWIADKKVDTRDVIPDNWLRL
jgi:hypothetical protein